MKVICRINSERVRKCHVAALQKSKCRFRIYDPFRFVAEVIVRYDLLTRRGMSSARETVALITVKPDTTLWLCVVRKDTGRFIYLFVYLSKWITPQEIWEILLIQ